MENVEKQRGKEKVNKPEKRVLTNGKRDDNLTKLSDSESDAAEKILKKMKKTVDK